MGATSFCRRPKLSVVWTSSGTLDHKSEEVMNCLEIGRVDLIGWYSFVVDDGREFAEMS